MNIRLKGLVSALGLLLLFFFNPGAWGAEIKITELPAATVMSDDDIFVIVDSPGAAPITKKIARSATGLVVGPASVTDGNSPCFDGTTGKLLKECAGGGSGIPIVVAGGTVDVITATYTPAITLADKTLAAFVATGANTITTPTFTPDGLATHTIVKQGGVALVVGDIPRALYVCLLEYNLANTRWELLNPAFVQTTISGNAGTATALAANPAGCTGGQVTTDINASGVSSCTSWPANTLSTLSAADYTAMKVLWGLTISTDIMPWVSPTGKGLYLFRANTGGTAFELTNSLTGLTFGGFTASYGIESDVSGNLVSVAPTGTGSTVRANTPTLITPIITNPEVDGSVTNASITPAQVSGTVIYNTGMGATAATLTLPAAASGYAFIAQVGETSAAAWTIATASAGTLWLDGEGAHNSIALATPTQGNYATCYTAKMAGTGIYTSANLRIGTTNTNVRTDAFNFAIAGTGYSKAAVDAGTILAGDTVPANKFGAWALDIGVNGTIDIIPATLNGTAPWYADAAAAAAGLPAVAGSHLRLGYVTANHGAATFIPGTTTLDEADVIEAYTSTAVYTPAYHWFCKSGTATLWVHE